MTPDDVRRAADVLTEVAERFDYTLSGTARREMRNSGEDLRWLLRQADFRPTLDPTDSTYRLIGDDYHQHVLQGVVLTHDHAGGGVPHGYFGHPEDPPATMEDSPMATRFMRANDAVFDAYRDLKAAILEPGGELHRVVLAVEPAAVAVTYRIDHSADDDGLRGSLVSVELADGTVIDEDTPDESSLLEFQDEVEPVLDCLADCVREPTGDNVRVVIA